MKHLKPYKIFESESPLEDSEILNTVWDICLELQDDGYTINMGRHKETGDYLCYVSRLERPHDIKSFNLKFDYKDVKETTDRVIEYLDDKYLDTEVYVKSIFNTHTGVFRHINAGWHGIDNVNGYLDNIWSLKIIFKLSNINI